MNAPRIPVVTHISQVRLRTAEPGRALGFYEGVLGLSITGKTGRDTEVGASKTGPGFIVLTEDPRAVARPLRTTGLYHLAIRLPGRRDLAHVLQRLLRVNYPIEGAADHDVSEAIYLSDPDGNGVELYADRPAPGWRWQDGQVAMSTKPLDMADLLNSIRGEPAPGGLPPATDLGHIHLQVANLGVAEHFFRDFLGLDVTQRSYPGALFFSAGGYHHHVAVNTWAGQAAPPANSTGLLSYRLEVPSSEALANLRERAAAFGFKTRKAGLDAGPNLLVVSDPTGNWLEIGSPSPAPAGRSRIARARIFSTN